MAIANLRLTLSKRTQAKTHKFSRRNGYDVLPLNDICAKMINSSSMRITAILLRYPMHLDTIK